MIEFTERKIKVLDDEYQIKLVDRMPEGFEDSDAITDPIGKIITMNGKSLCPNQTLRHEIIHAFLFASGLGFNFEHRSIGHEETIIDWYALQYPKIKKLYRELDIED